MRFFIFYGLIVWILSAGLSCTSVQVSQTLNEISKTIGGEPPLTAAEVADGLREALIQGISKGSDLVSQTDGYFKNPEIKIPFPEDAKKVENTLRDIGLSREVDRFILTLNRGAEQAAKEAKPIFVQAIRSMTIDDAWAILKGESDAATRYLKRTTYTQLREKFKPVIQNALQQVNATRYYSELVTRYNQIPMVEKMNPHLDDYATDKAIEGLFVMIAKEEKLIREDPLARTTDLLKRVFGYNK